MALLLSTAHRSVVYQLHCSSAILFSACRVSAKPFLFRSVIVNCPIVISRKQKYHYDRRGFFLSDHDIQDAHSNNFHASLMQSISEFVIAIIPVLSDTIFNNVLIYQLIQLLRSTSPSFARCFVIGPAL